ncbi:hypothetical protein Ahy_B01g052035 [Arachis hypogaea]|uniref:Aminotransferase-like plant mobile domain-containing protein n=1 Tax=Arachis hypogaea TaxID=3818 RepID=A0A445ANF9_ARAHY|nr:hypothetical protein Ahy_B01g052035 [Arachis hypogaea]
MDCDALVYVKQKNLILITPSLSHFFVFSSQFHSKRLASILINLTPPKIKKLTKQNGSTHTEDQSPQLNQSHSVSVEYNNSHELVIGSRNLHMRHLHEIDSYNNRVEEQLRASGFYYVSQIGRIVSHRPTVDALIERWRLKTHTFHFSYGRRNDSWTQTDGLSVIGSTDHSTSGLENECLAQFGVVPGPNHHKGSGIKLAWFRTLKRRQHLTDQKNTLSFSFPNTRSFPFSVSFTFSQFKALPLPILLFLFLPLSFPHSEALLLSFPLPPFQLQLLPSSLVGFRHSFMLLTPFST